jgi:hypothetical protein
MKILNLLIPIPLCTRAQEHLFVRQYDLFGKKEPETDFQKIRRILKQ